MVHLTVEEMIDFVSFKKPDDRILALASKVNAHVYKCEECREKLEAFQTVYDGLVKYGREITLKKSISKQITKKLQETAELSRELVSEPVEHFDNTKDRDDEGLTI